MEAGFVVHMLNFFVVSFQYVAYAEGLIRAYNIHTYAVHYTLQREFRKISRFSLSIFISLGVIISISYHLQQIFVNLAVDNTIKLIGASSFAFHPTLEWIFVGDRRGTLLAWDVSTERPNMIGM